jgi:hypothetical protein
MRRFFLLPRGKPAVSIFTTPLSQLGTADLKQLLTDAAVESVRLEFKLEVPNKDDTLKKLSSFANTFGGFMVVGARANSADGRIEDLPGVEVQAGYKQKIVQWCFDGASPPLTVEVSDPIPTPGADGRVCYVISAPESDVARHFLNGRKGVWLRTDEFSSHYEARLADETELRHLFDRRKVIVERRIGLMHRARLRFDTYIERTAGSLTGNRTPWPRLELSVVPRFPARPLCEQERLKHLIENKQLLWRQTRFPVLNTGVVSQHESAIILRPTGDLLSICEGNIWGLFFYGTRIDDNHGGTVGIHPYAVAGYLLLFLTHATEILEELGFSGQLLVQTTLTSIFNHQWLDPRSGIGFYVRPGTSQLDDEISFSVDSTSDVMREDPDRVTRDLLRYVFFSVNWADLISTPKELEALIGWGKNYNFWSQH